MCGRFVRKSTLTEIKDEFDLYEIQWAWEPSYNIAPGQEVAGVVKNSGNLLVGMRWGFIPWWAEDESIGYRMINARAETLAHKRSFSRAFKSQLCLIIADGFYEWQKIEDNKKKIPFYIHLRSNQPFGFAGLYDRWKSKEGTSITSCTIITTMPNELIEPIHNRMPAIIQPENREQWLNKDVQDTEKLMDLLQPYKAEEMEAYEVGMQVNSPKYNRPECIKPAGKVDQQNLF
jgi:putative SOS response-associated peptidase YedK